jgi:glutamate racemase
VPQHSLILESANGHLFDASINRAYVGVGSIASILACPRHVRLGDNPGNAGCPVLIDPAPAIARRASDLLGPPGRESNEAGAEMIFTSGRQHALSQALMPFFGGRVPA